MQLTRVAPDVWRISTPMPFPPRSVHAYLLRAEGNRWVLVDGGLNTDEAWGALEQAVRRLTGSWQRLVLHAVTHMHQDHMGLSELVREVSEAPLAMGELDAERAAHAAAEPAEEAQYRESLLRENGVAEDVIRAIQRGRAKAGPMNSFVPADYPLPQGIAPLPQIEGWEAVWTPGHTAGHISLWRASDRLLIAGDAVLPHITPTIGVNRQREDPVGDYLATLSRLEELDPTLILAGHGDAIEQPALRITELRAATLEATERVAEALASGPATAWEVTRARYAWRDLSPSNAMLALRETLAHLHHLGAADRARSESEAGVVRFFLL